MEPRERWWMESQAAGAGHQSCSPGSELGPVLLDISTHGLAGNSLSKIGSQQKTSSLKEESPSLGDLAEVWMWHLGTGVGGGFGSAGLTVGLGDPKGLCQPKQLQDSMFGFHQHSRRRHLDVTHVAAV